jgi:hypothetical protein
MNKSNDTGNKDTKHKDIHPTIQKYQIHAIDASLSINGVHFQSSETTLTPKGVSTPSGEALPVNGMNEMVNWHALAPLTNVHTRAQC